MRKSFVSNVIAFKLSLGSLLVLGTMGTNSILAQDARFVLLQTPESLDDSSKASGSESSSDPKMPTQKTLGMAAETEGASDSVWIDRVVQAKPDSLISKQAFEVLKTDYELNSNGKEAPVTLQDLPKFLSQAVGVPVWLNQRAVEFAKLGVATETIQFSATKEPLATSLHRVLNPIGLKAVVQNEGIVITADRIALARKGIGASKWASIDEDSANVIEAALDQVTTVNFADETLEEALSSLGDQHGIPIVVDLRALDEVGLSAEIPVTLSLPEVKLRTVLDSMLRSLDLTLTIDHEVLKVTTMEAAEARPLIRVYLMSGLGFPKDNATQAIDLIQTTISPDTWEALGGPSTMREMQTGEHVSLVVATTYEVHHQIESLLASLRAESFEQDPIAEKIEVPREQIPGSAGQSGGMF